MLVFIKAVDWAFRLIAEADVGNSIHTLNEIGGELLSFEELTCRFKPIAINLPFVFLSYSLSIRDTILLDTRKTSASVSVKK